jgi:hypothetical protein
LVFGFEKGDSSSSSRAVVGISRLWRDSQVTVGRVGKLFWFHCEIAEMEFGGVGVDGDHRSQSVQMPRVINVDKNPAYPAAVEALKAVGASQAGFDCASASISTM